MQDVLGSTNLSTSSSHSTQQSHKEEFELLNQFELHPVQIYQEGQEWYIVLENTELQIKWTPHLREFRALRYLHEQHPSRVNVRVSIFRIPTFGEDGFALDTSSTKWQQVFSHIQSPSQSICHTAYPFPSHLVSMTEIKKQTTLMYSSGGLMIFLKFSNPNHMSRDLKLSYEEQEPIAVIFEWRLVNEEG
ncbi:MAG: hypothetical protein Sylvanvirus4_35 [Sylvanvirus sp.]|uniref:Uncharacterized protein n=1 Tax=Sylvanvirus sp. TaxID=2487774 RepID=A0A3G5AJJ1_9VIRU|nr:MAG: hypothetical protein Sylvanvirus4_35 [Sylvanvirus sp.]